MRRAQQTHHDVATVALEHFDTPAGHLAHVPSPTGYEPPEQTERQFVLSTFVTLPARQIQPVRASLMEKLFAPSTLEAKKRSQADLKEMTEIAHPLMQFGTQFLLSSLYGARHLHVPSAFAMAKERVLISARLEDGEEGGLEEGN